jgi:hypothetical protein
MMNNPKQKFEIPTDGAKPGKDSVKQNRKEQPIEPILEGFDGSRIWETMSDWVKEHVALPTTREGWIRLGLRTFLFSALQASASTYVVERIEWRQPQGSAPVMVPLESYPHQPWNLLGRVILLGLIGGQLYTGKKPKWLCQLVLDTVSDPALPRVVTLIEDTDAPVVEVSSKKPEPQTELKNNLKRTLQAEPKVLPLSVATPEVKPEQGIPAIELFGEIDETIPLINTMTRDDLIASLGAKSVIRFFPDEDDTSLALLMLHAWQLEEDDVTVLEKQACNYKQFMLEYKKGTRKFACLDGLFWQDVNCDIIDLAKLKVTLTLNGKPSGDQHKEMLSNWDSDVIFGNSKAKSLLLSNIEIPEKRELMGALEDGKALLVRLENIWSICK